MASPEEGLMLFRSDPGLGAASWAAMMRPSCCKDKPAVQSVKHQDNHTGIAAALLTG